MGSPFAARDLPKSVDARCGRPLGGADVEDAPIDPVRWRNRRGKLHPSPARRRRWFQFARSLRRGIYGWRARTGKLRVGFIPVRCNVSPARTRAGARDVVGTPEQAAIVHRAVGTAPMARCLLEARLGVRGLRCDPVSGLRCRWLVRSRILAVLLCDVRPDDSSLRVSYGLLNLAHRDGDETPAPLIPGRRYRVSIRFERCGCGVAGAPDQGGALHDLLADDLASP